MNEQEKKWSSEFGNKYIDRNNDEKIIDNNINLFSEALKKCRNVKTICELGCGIGFNLLALGYIYPYIQKTGVEINKLAIEKLCKHFENRYLDIPLIVNKSATEFTNLVSQGDANSPTPEYRYYDLVFTKGLLIHINPNDLEKVYDNLYNLSSRYILICEYYNPTPVEIEYHGEMGLLWKRDFCGEMLDKYPKLKLIDYGFVYHRDTAPQDDLSWFLMEKV